MLRLSDLPFRRQELALVAITMFWGGTFPIIHYALTLCGPFFFVGCRFILAALLLGFCFRKALREAAPHDVFAGCVIGVVAFLGYFLQTYGLQTISSSRSAFLTALYVPLVPIMQWLFLRRPPTFMNWIGVLCAFAGLLLMLVTGEPAPADHLDLALALAAGLGLATAVIQLTMNWAQRSVSPTRATLIYASEPVWGGFFGRLTGDRLPLPALIGAACIVTGVLVSEWKRKK